MLTFDLLRRSNLSRLPQFRNAKGELSHVTGISDKGWSASDWLMAVTGELGEAANLLKKIIRGDFTLDEKRQDVADELGDVVIYLDLLAAKLNINLDDAVVRKFNIVSDRIGCKVKL